MPARRAIVSVAALAAGVLAAPGADAAAAPLLAGVTVVSGARSASVDVRVPRAVTLRTPFGGGDGIAVSGGAALTAVVLAGLDGKARGVTIAGGATSVSGDTQRFLMPVPQWPSLGGGSYEDIKTFGPTTLLPAGTYRLYFVSSAPATVTLRLPGLPGRRTIVPARAARGAVEPADHELSGNPVRNNVFAATNTAKLARRGFALQALQARLETETTWQLVMCHNNPADAAVEQVKDAPVCPAGDKHTFVNHRYPSVTPDTKLFVQAFAGLPPGEHGLGTVYTVQSNTTSIAYSAVWLEY
ncbi:MAG TPA: hypothetical protein VNA20_01995 [Frankiaceae bacterium]|nr:hypothetical protein [Frankiaceae bacterium]